MAMRRRIKPTVNLGACSIVRRCPSITESVKNVKKINETSNSELNANGMDIKRSASSYNEEVERKKFAENVGVIATDNGEETLTQMHTDVKGDQVYSSAERAPTSDVTLSTVGTKLGTEQTDSGNINGSNLTSEASEQKTLPIVRRRIKPNVNLKLIASRDKEKTKPISNTNKRESFSSVKDRTQLCVDKEELIASVQKSGENTAGLQNNPYSQENETLIEPPQVHIKGQAEELPLPTTQRTSVSIEVVSNANESNTIQEKCDDEGNFAVKRISLNEIIHSKKYLDRSESTSRVQDVSTSNMVVASNIESIQLKSVNSALSIDKKDNENSEQKQYIPIRRRVKPMINIGKSKKSKSTKIDDVIEQSRTIESSCSESKNSREKEVATPINNSAPAEPKTTAKPRRPIKPAINIHTQRVSTSDNSLSSNKNSLELKENSNVLKIVKRRPSKTVFEDKSQKQSLLDGQSESSPSIVQHQANQESQNNDVRSTRSAIKVAPPVHGVVEVLSNDTVEKDNLEIALNSIRGSVRKESDATKSDEEHTNINVEPALKRAHIMANAKDSLKGQSASTAISTDKTKNDPPNFIVDAVQVQNGLMKLMDISDLIDDIEMENGKAALRDVIQQLGSSSEDENENLAAKANQSESEEYPFKPPMSVKCGNLENATRSLGDEHVLQLDMQKSNQTLHKPPSKLLAHKRIRPVPVINQRRNSLVDSVPSPVAADDPYMSMEPSPKRERCHGSPYQSHATAASPLAYVGSPKKHNRIRTESCSSVYSEGGSRRHRAKHMDHGQRQDFEARFENGVPEKQKMKMFDMLFYNPSTNPMRPKSPSVVKLEDVKSEVSYGESEKKEKTDPDDPADCQPVPQLKLNEHGEIILDDTSLEIETSAEQEARKVLANSSLIELDENTGMNGFYTRQKRTREWSGDETIKFYKCLQTIGTDFSLMVQLFPNRTRRDLKLKFKKEERINPALINKALMNPKMFNIEELKTHLEEEERRRHEEALKWMQIKRMQPKKIKKESTFASTAARVLKHGDDVYENEHITKDKFGKRVPKSEFEEASSQTDAGSRSPSAPQVSTSNWNVPDKTKRQRRKRPTAAKQLNAEKTTTNFTISDNNPVEFDESISHNSSSSTDTTVIQIGIITSADDVLEYELDDLLNVSDLEPSISLNASSISISEAIESNEHITPKLIMEDIVLEKDEGQHTDREQVTTKESIPEEDSHTLVNLDDGTVTEYPLVDSNTADTIGNGDIQQILMELSKGTLALVTTADPTSPDRVINEIYMTDSDGNIGANPLNIPDDLIESIISVMS